MSPGHSCVSYELMLSGLVVGSSRRLVAGELSRGWQRRPLTDAARGGLLPHAPAVLHDMAASIAEAVASVYLAEARLRWHCIAIGTLTPRIFVLESIVGSPA